MVTSPQRLFTDLAGAYDWLNSHINYERELGRIAYNNRVFELNGFLRRIEALGRPQLGLRTIHIAGTRGKGSAALMLEALLRASGLRVATYTSPHIREYRERIRIDGEVIAPELFVRCLQRIAPLDENGAATGLQFKTVFEHLTALFFLAARATAVDWAVVETGLGGRLDATNVVAPGPVLLTRIGLEHTHLLGRTIPAIAGEKAAILKPGGWGVVSAQAESEGAMEVFAQRARRTGARLDRAADLCPIRRVTPDASGLRVVVEFEGELLTVGLPLYGPCQAENLQNALAMLSRLREEGLIARAPREALAAALASVSIPGRMERWPTAPPLIIDAAHCPTGADALVQALEAHFPGTRTHLLVGMMADKEHDGFFAALARWPGWRRVVCYPVDSPRGASAADLADCARRHFPDVTLCTDLAAGLELALRIADKKDQIVAAGTVVSIAFLQDWAATRLTMDVQQDGPSETQSR